MLKNILLFFITLALLLTAPIGVFAGNCDYSWQTDSAGRRCGGRAADVRPGGKLGGDGRYTDSYGRKRLYGKDNDPYDSSRKSNGLYENNGLYDTYRGLD